MQSYKREKEFDPDTYVTQPGLEFALRGARAMKQPLLLTGEPGTGKTLFAKWAANQFKAEGFHPEPIEFVTKTSSVARDLLYSYDALSHFQAANLKRDKNDPLPETRNYIELQALGKAIAMTNPTVDRSKFTTVLPEKTVNSIVLIDEVDKAPRDFTNDLLREIVDFSFKIREVDYEVKKGPDAEIIIILTSNSEKGLPDAFLRRCVYYNIPFPDPQGPVMREIVEKQLGEAHQFSAEGLQNLLAFFDEIRNNTVRKKPATAELVAWLRFLSLEGYEHKENKVAQRKKLLEHNMAFLIKTEEDLKAVKGLVEKAKI